MRRILNTIKIFKLITAYPDLFNIVKAIFDTLSKTAIEGMPRTQSIIIDFKTIDIPQIELNLWVCVGEGNPISRIQELRKEIETLKGKPTN